MHQRDSLHEGHYAKKQLFTRSPLINWSHRARFRLGLRLIAPFAGQRVLDYGCGDGTFLAMLMKTPTAPSLAVGVEIDDGQVLDCRQRHTDSRLSFLRVDELDRRRYTSAFDALVCTEVLEHVIDRAPVFDRWRWLVKPGGTLVISVPVETGPALVVKQVLRHIAGWRGIGDYPGIAPYSWSEFAKSALAGTRQHIMRPIYRDPDGNGSYCHKGFNWRTLRLELKEHFVFEETHASPVPLLPPSLNSQAWFICRRRN